MNNVKMVGKKITSHPWAIVDGEKVSQCRFESQKSAHIALRNYLLYGPDNR